MGTTHHCEHCEADFEAKDPRHPRCPTCLRTHGIATVGGVEEAPEDRAEERPRPGAVVAMATLIVIGSGVAWWWFASTGGGPADARAPAGAADRADLLTAARAGFESGDLKAAYRAADQAVRANPKDGVARELLGDVLLASRAQQEALNEYIAALSVAERGELHVKAGNLFLALGVPESAGRHLAKALEMEPEAPWAAAVREALAELPPGALPVDPGVATTPTGAPTSAPTSPPDAPGAPPKVE